MAMLTRPGALIFAGMLILTAPAAAETPAAPAAADAPQADVAEADAEAPAAAADPQTEPLPEPLTLDYALGLADEPHPNLLAAAAERDSALARRDLAAAAYGINAGVTADAIWSEPSNLAFDQTYNNSQAGVYVRKRLYDFGRTRGLVAAAEAQLTGQELRFADSRLQHGLDILDSYLNVLLADLRFRVHDEAMAIAYTRMDRANDRHELGQISDIERFEADTLYQETRSARFLAQAAQRTARVRLAEALNRPGQLSGTLAEPELAIVDREPPELETLIAEVLQANPRVLSLRAEAEASRERIQAARALERPVLTGHAEANEYQRQTGSTDPWAVGLQVEVPLFTGGRGAAERAQARAGLARSEAELARAQQELRQTVQSLWEEIQVLRASRDETRTRQEYRELYLDRSRALYEMEFNSDLGDSMVLSSEARLRQAELDYRLLLNWARLNALRGRELFAQNGAAAVPNDTGEGRQP